MSIWRTIGILISISIFAISTASTVVAQQDQPTGIQPAKAKPDNTKNQNADDAKPDSTDSKKKKGINDSFLNPELDPQDFVKRFEIESREVYSARHEILKACNIQPEMTIADVGAGTGLYSRLFSRATGRKGWVYAVDISTRLLQHAIQESRKSDQRNVTGVLCQEDSVCLPPNSVDLVFICDTYHHFEHHEATLASILSALKPGGTMIVIDFKRIEGQTRPWLLNHVRAGQEVFQAEIEKAGFELVEEVDLVGLEENYFLKFRKPAK